MHKALDVRTLLPTLFVHQRWSAPATLSAHWTFHL